MERRDFLKWQMAGIAALGLPAQLVAAEEADPVKEAMQEAAQKVEAQKAAQAGVQADGRTGGADRADQADRAGQAQKKGFSGRNVQTGRNVQPGEAERTGQAAQPGGKPDLVVVKGKPGEATRAAVKALGGMAAFVKPGWKVVIKPNMSFPKGVESATNTHPDVVRELVRLCLEAGASVLVLDHAFQSGTASLEHSGILAACESVKKGICQNLTQSRFYEEVALPGARQMKTAQIMKDVLEADMIIAAPVAKTNSATGVSLSLKGQMGLVYDRGIMHSQYDLDTAVVDLCFRLKPRLSIIDASRVLATNGPYGPGRVLEPREIIASADPVAADALAVASYEWYGRHIEPRQVAHIAQAHARGLGRMDIDHLGILRIEA